MSTETTLPNFNTSGSEAVAETKAKAPPVHPVHPVVVAICKKVAWGK